MPLPLALKMFRTPLVGEVMVQGLDAFKRAFLFGQGITKPQRITPTVRRAYMDVNGQFDELIVGLRERVATDRRSLSNPLFDRGQSRRARPRSGLDRPYRDEPITWS